MTTEQVVLALTPLVILGVTQLVTWATGKIDGRIVITIIPIITLLGAWVTSLITPEVPFWGQVGFGLISTFVYELVKQWTKPKV